MKGSQELYKIKIVTTPAVTGIKGLLNICQTIKKQDWNDQPFCNQFDLYVIPEVLIYEIFNHTPGFLGGVLQ